MLVVLAENGQALWSSIGLPDQVRLTDTEVTHIRALHPYLITHNHPNGLSLSDDDVPNAMALGVREIHAVTPQRRFVLALRPGATWPLPGDAHTTLVGLREQIVVVLERERARGNMSLGRLLHLERHLRWQYFSKIYQRWLHYSVEDR